MDTAIVGVLATILGALIGGWITYRFSLDIAKRNLFNQLAVQFRTSFTDELTKLTTSIEETYDILKRAAAKHVAAGFAFRWVLQQKEREQFDQAWRKFYSADQDPKQAYLEKYSKNLSDAQSGIPKSGRRQAAIDRIEEILKFAKMK
jgi:hypothetical protein